MDKELIILAIYVNVGAMSKHGVDSLMREMMSQHEDMYRDTNKNVKIYWLPVGEEQPTRVECVYPPPSLITNGIIEDELLKLYKVLLNVEGTDEAKEIIKDIERKLKFKKINDKLNET